MDVDECIAKRRDTRHFLSDPVPPEVLNQALKAAHSAPSVGLSEPWRFVIVTSLEKRAGLLNSFLELRSKSEMSMTDSEQKILHASLKLEAIEQAPVIMGVFCERPNKDIYTIGTQGTENTYTWSCACAVQNIWLSLTAQGYGAGWVSILNFDMLKSVLMVPSAWEPLGILCIGKPADTYGGQPMLENLGWKSRSESPQVLFR